MNAAGGSFVVKIVKVVFVVVGACGQLFPVHDYCCDVVVVMYRGCDGGCYGYNSNCCHCSWL